MNTLCKYGQCKKTGCAWPLNKDGSCDKCGTINVYDKVSATARIQSRIFNAIIDNRLLAGIGNPVLYASDCPNENEDMGRCILCGGIHEHE